MGADKSVSAATVDIGKIFVEGGFFGLVIYAILLVFFLLLVRDFLKDWLIRSVSKEQTVANEKVAAALAQVAVEMRAINIVLAQVISATGWREFKDQDDDDKPEGLLP